MKLVMSVVILVSALIQSECNNRNIRARVIVRPFVKKPPKFNRTELLALWANTKSDPEADVDPDGEDRDTDSSKAVTMGKNKHIINGKTAIRGQFPWQVAMVMDDDFFCGGSVISTTCILTAAHCAENVKIFDIALGAQNRDQLEDGRITMQSTSAVTHQNWNSDTVNNDIAIIFLPRAIKLSDYIQLIRLPRKSSSKRGFVRIKGKISGFGRTSDELNNVSNSLNFVKMKIIPLIQCAKLYGKDSVNEKNLCLKGVGRGNRGTCNGDSGGPFVHRERKGGFTQLGIVSYGAASGCAKGYPDVFTKVAYFLPWIVEQCSQVKLRD